MENLILGLRDTIVDFDIQNIKDEDLKLNHKINDIILLSPSGQNKNFLISEKII